MTTFSEVRETSSPFDGLESYDDYDGYIEKIQQVLRANHLAFGTPTDFLTLARALENNSRLRNDLAALLRSFMEEEQNITLRTILNLIAVASGGSDFTSAHSMRRPVSDSNQPVSNGNESLPVGVLVDFLLGVGSNSTQTSVQNPDHPFDNPHSELSDGETPQAVPLPSPSSDYKTPREQLDDAGDPGALEAVQAGSDQTSPPHPDTENSLVESLIRLELNALQVKHYLDSIDQRISRIEPRLDSLPTQVSSTATPHFESGSKSENESLPDGRYSAMIATETLPEQAPKHETPPPESPRTRTPAQTTIPSEMSSLLESSSRQKLSRSKFEVPIITGAALVLLLLLYWGFNQNTQSPAIESVNSLTQNTTTPSSNPAPATNVNSSRPPESTNRPFHNSAPLRPGTASSSSFVPATPSSTSSENSEKTIDRPHFTKEPVNVSSGVMAANVLSAPQPSYPILASLTHMRGEVVMQATISKEGTIEDVRVIKGHRLLRGAATSAVRNWRYRPYLVNGRPVEVATTVSVDFKQ